VAIVYSKTENFFFPYRGDEGKTGSTISYGLAYGLQYLRIGRE